MPVSLAVTLAENLDGDVDPKSSVKELGRELMLQFLQEAF